MAITTPIIFNTRDELIKVDIDKMIESEESHGAVHIHQIQLPIVRVGSQIGDISFDEAYQKETLEKLPQSDIITFVKTTTSCPFSGRAFLSAKNWFCCF